MKKFDDKKFDKRLAYNSWILFFISVVLFFVILIFNPNFNIHNLNNSSDYVYLILGYVSFVFFITSMLGLSTLYVRKICKEKHNK